VRLAKAEILASTSQPLMAASRGEGSMQEQAFEVREESGIPVISAPEEIDIGNANELRSALVAASERHPMAVVDLSQTQFCDSSALNVLVRALRRAQEAGGELRLVACTPSVERILSVTGVGGVFPLFTTLADALAVPAEFAPTSDATPSDG
jgi:anti-anti-sigma factor